MGCFSTLVAFSILSVQPSPDALRTVEEATQVALESRRVSSDEEKRYVREIAGMLEEYAGPNRLTGAVYRMLIDGLIIDPDDLHVSGFQRSEDFFEGVSGNPVYFARDGEGELVSVVKAFPMLGDEMPHCMRQLSSSALLDEMRLQESSHAGVVMLGAGRRGERRYALVALEPAKGQELRKLIEQVGALPREERSLPFAELTRAVTKVGRALAELHVKSAQEEEPGPFYLQHRARARRSLAAALENQVAGIDEAGVDAALESLHRAAWADPGLIGFIHGDAHPGNFFYDGAEDRVTMIDTDALHRSIGRRGEPSAPVILDLDRFVNFFRVLAHFEQLSQEESDYLVDAFEAAYWSFPGTVPLSREARLYWRLLFWIDRCGTWGAPAPGQSPQLRQHLAKLLPYVVEQVRLTLEEFSQLG